MIKSKKIKWLILLSATGIILLILFIAGLNFPTRNSIPQIPENISSKQLHNQLRTAYWKAVINPCSDNLGELGIAYHSASEYQRAAACYQLALKKNEANWQWNYYLGYLQKEMGNSQQVIKNFRTVVQKNPNAFHAWYYLGEELHKTGETIKAIETFKNIEFAGENNTELKHYLHTDHFPFNIYVKNQMAMSFINSNDLDLAEEQLNEIIRDNKSFGLAYRLLGRLYRLKGDTVLSEKYIVRANDLIAYTSPVDTLIDQIAQRSRSEFYLLKQIDEADKMRYFGWESQLVKQGLKYLPENKYMASKAITFYFKTDSAKNALPLLKEHFNSFYNDFNELQYVAKLLFENRYFAQSNIYYKRALELKPEKTDIQVYLVLGLFYQNEKQKALDLMDNFVDNEMDNPEFLENAVVELLGMGEYEKAGIYLEKLKKLTPESSKSFLLSGQIAQQNGDLKKAELLFKTAFQLTPDDLVCMKSLSDVLMRQKLWKESINHFETSMEYFPNEPYLLEIYGTLLVVCPELDLRNYVLGKEYLERAFYHKDCPPEIAISAGKSLADVYFATGDSQTASYYLRIVISYAKSLGVSQEYTDKLEKKLDEMSII